MYAHAICSGVRAGFSLSITRRGFERFNDFCFFFSFCSCRVKKSAANCSDLPMIGSRYLKFEVFEQSTGGPQQAEMSLVLRSR
jgi:hypothetical protein